MLFFLLMPLALAVDAQTGENSAKTDAPLSSPSSRISVFSGLAVPRFANLRFSKVNGRAGPGLRYPVVWKYQRTGLPVVIIRESPDWRKIRDPDNEEVWVHKRMLTTPRHAISTSEGDIYADPDSNSLVLAHLHPGIVVSLTGCNDNHSWCMIAVETYRGWVRRDVLWGMDDDAGG